MRPLRRATVAHARRRVLVKRCRFASNAKQTDSRNQKRERDYKPVGFSPNTARTQHSTGGLHVALADARQLREPVDVQRLSQNAPINLGESGWAFRARRSAVRIPAVARPWDGSQQVTWHCARELERGS